MKTSKNLEEIAEYQYTQEQKTNFYVNGVCGFPTGKVDRCK